MRFAMLHKWIKSSLDEVISDVERHLRENGPWGYKLSQVYDEPEVTATVERLTAEEQAKFAA